ncbi:MAG: MOSC domain-containing protein [Myxococcota bacterium]
MTDRDGAHVVAIHVAKATRLPMRAVESVDVEAGRGLVGDRYHGTRHRHLTIQATGELAEAARRHGAAIDPGATRRNVTIEAASVPRKPGTRFRVGGIDVEVVRDAAPCKLLEDALGRDARLALSRRAGVVCRVLSSGTLHVGDTVELATEA